MSERPMLDALAERCGIATTYVGYDGQPRSAPERTREVLLAALGFDASSEALARQALSALDAERPALAPVRVTRAGASELGELELQLQPEQHGRARYRIELRLEQGALHALEGEIDSQGGVLRLPVPAATELSFGYHTLRCELDLGAAPAAHTQDLIVVPGRCVQPSEVIGRRKALGLWTHVYTLCSARSLGIGDLTDLQRLGAWAGNLGLDFVGINPLHAVDNGAGEVSPYYPLSRCFRNPIYLDVDRVVERAGAAAVAEALHGVDSTVARAELRAQPRVDYARAFAEKRRVLQAAHRVFAQRAVEGTSELGRDYAVYRAREGRALADFATFCALREQLAADDARRQDFRQWPAAYRDPRSPEVAAFAAEQAETIDFHAYLQFELDEQLAACQRSARQSGMAIGLYGDLAVGDAPFAAEVWANPRLYAQGVNIGAPPDAYSDSGQEWGLTPLHPLALREDRYRLVRALLQRAFRHSGMLRVDHVMGLTRQFWVPAGESARAGAYVRYPAQDLLGLLALESRRALALVVGEDLGVVPEGFRETMAQQGLLRSQVLYFERGWDGGFVAPRDYAEGALVTTSTHDLPPLAGFLSGRDLELRRRAGNIASDELLEQARAERARAAVELVALLRREGWLADSATPELPAIAEALQLAIASSASKLVGIALDDLTLEQDALNTPASSLPDAPNWSRRCRLTLEQLTSDHAIREVILRIRGRAGAG